MSAKSFSRSGHRSHFAPRDQHEDWASPRRVSQISPIQRQLSKMRPRSMGIEDFDDVHRRARRPSTSSRSPASSRPSSLQLSNALENVSIASGPSLTKAKLFLGSSDDIDPISPTDSLASPLSPEVDTTQRSTYSPTQDIDALSHYTLGKTIGEGAFAKVRLAVHRATGMEVAIKILTKDRIKEDYVRENLHREGQLMKDLKHPNIAQLYEIVETDKLYCLVMELAPGGELLDYIVAHRALPENEVRKYARQMVSVLGYLDSKGIVHRDLKAENLLLDHDLNLKIVDFGLANRLNDDGVLDTQCGSPAYSAPELLGGKRYDNKVDVWSVGINMYAMLTGKLPFPSHNVTELHALILDQAYEVPKHFSKELVALLKRVLAARAKDRMSVREFACDPWLVAGAEPVSVDFGSEDNASLDLSAIEIMTCKFGHSSGDVETAVKTRAMNGTYATYQLVKLQRKKDLHRPSKPLSRSRTVSTLPSSASSSSSGTSSARRSARRNSHRATPSPGPSRNDSTESFTSTLGFEPTSARKPSARRRTISGPVSVPMNSVPPAGPKRRSSRASEHSLVERDTLSSRRAQRSGSICSRRKSASLDGPTGLPTLRRGSMSRQASNPSPPLYLPSDDRSSPIKIKTLRCPLSRQMVSHKSPSKIYKEMTSALKRLHLSWRRQDDDSYCVRTTEGEVCVEAEVVRLPGLSMHGVHFKRIRGETAPYRELCARLIDVMDL
eukprot:TRINITY_DN12556_c0_g4_i1.p1 TRINITY_DN12556_c0_g4~~TRINITY_DN12556_c0_g4_i1.p1  ORF type:complete len:725 (+),score=93.73 TRINITY_DN12556_c0_g4_i1:133-2307(+)